jgi:hypothetical protein
MDLVIKLATIKRNLKAHLWYSNKRCQTVGLHTKLNKKMKLTNHTKELLVLFKVKDISKDFTPMPGPQIKRNGPKKIKQLPLNKQQLIKLELKMRKKITLL